MANKPGAKLRACLRMAGSETRRNCGAAADLRCSPFRSLQQGGPPGDCRLAIRPDSRSGLKIWGITTFMPHSEPVVVAAGAENLFSFLLFYVALQRFDVLLESIHACRGNAAERAGYFSPKGLFDRDVAGFLQFVDLYAQVARRSSRLFPDENEVGLFDPEEDRPLPPGAVPSAAGDSVP